MRMLLAIMVFTMSVYWIIIAPGAAQAPLAIIEVRPGDTIWKIAAAHSTKQQDIRDVIANIRRLNQLDANCNIYPGQSLTIPK